MEEIGQPANFTQIGVKFAPGWADVVGTNRDEVALPWRADEN
jgi:hypothetical protein